MNMSRNIHFGTTELIKEMKNKPLMISIKQPIQAYHCRGFKLKAILGEGQFKHIQQPIQQKGITLNICTTN